MKNCNRIISGLQVWIEDRISIIEMGRSEIPKIEKPKTQNRPTGVPSPHITSPAMKISQVFCHLFFGYHSKLLYDYLDNHDNQTASSDGLYVGGSGGSAMKSNRKMSQVFMWLISVGIGVPLGYYLIPDKMSVWQCLWYQCIIQ